VNKSDLARMIAERRGIHQRKADSVVKIVFDVMGEALKKKERIEIRGFGSFISKHYKAYVGRNPKTGEEIPITARRVVTFRPGQKLKARVEAYAGSRE